MKSTRVNHHFRFSQQATQDLRELRKIRGEKVSKTRIVEMALRNELQMEYRQTPHTSNASATQEFVQTEGNK